MRQLYLELEDPERANLASIRFEDDDADEVYTKFRTADGVFKVSFVEKMLPWMGPDHRLLGRFKAAEVNLWNPSGEARTTRTSSNPMEVYNKMMQAVYAYVVKFKPEVLSFVPSEPAMNPIYKRFYDRYLRRHYTLFRYLPMHDNTGMSYFLRNDLHEQMKEKLETGDHESAWDSDVRASRQKKLSSRGFPPQETAAPTKMSGFREWMREDSTNFLN